MRITCYFLIELLQAWWPCVLWIVSQLRKHTWFTSLTEIWCYGRHMNSRYLVNLMIIYFSFFPSPPETEISIHIQSTLRERLNLDKKWAQDQVPGDWKALEENMYCPLPPMFPNETLVRYPATVQAISHSLKYLQLPHRLQVFSDPATTSKWQVDRPV